MKKLLLVLAVLGLTQLTFAEKTHTVDTSASKLAWTGKKVTGKHIGTVSFKSGKVTLDSNGVLKSAEFIVDMDSINVTDLEGEWKAKLEGHLKNEDFFNTPVHKEARLKLQKILSKSGNTYEVESNLTIKKVTKPVKFKVTVEGNKMSGKLVFNRTNYGIKYGSGSFFSGLGDKMIFDDVELDFNVVTK
ncbi:YceI family protein [Bacteriovorax sp. DB6_IX]|uniref:YceI family protein n=1 Tax=Bacteriovorax sp. DB6_IX TaxID=1353530 RepID=UPI00038A43BF|nr:YceI family protein [Bacteriovorax sp. DB6_IX]EQC52347.1 YceI-like domain protein [Bacteriovorax sp. DB6_IX]